MSQSQRTMFRFAVWPDGGDPYEVDATMRDVIRWERASKSKAAGMKHLQATLYTTDLVKIAYHASVRSGLFQGTAQDFEDGVDWNLVPDDDERDARTRVLDAAVAWRTGDGELDALAAAVDELVALAEPDPTRPAR